MSSIIRGGDTTVLNRNTTDGDIVTLQKDSTTVGSIGAYIGGDRLYLGTGDTGLVFADSLDAIMPMNPSTNTARDAAIDIGYPTIRPKDLYLSGGVYLGGTGVANKLDDYESGTFTGTLTTSNYNVAYNSGGSATGHYVKVGDVVHFNIYISVNFSNIGTGSAYMTGLPFASKNTSGNFSWVSYGHGNFLEANARGGYVTVNGTHIVFVDDNATSSAQYRGTGVEYRGMVAGTYIAA